MKNFIEKITVLLQEQLGNDYNVRTEEVPKNNGIILHAVIISKESQNIFPTIYLEGYFEKYKDGMDIYDISSEIINEYLQHTRTDFFDISMLKDFEKTKKQIFFTLINTERNKDVLNETPHVSYLDFSIIFKVLIDSTDHGIATITIRNPLLELWDITVEELYNVALENTPNLLPCNAKNVLRLLTKEENLFIPLPDDTLNYLFPMFVLTNTQTFHGCGCILYPDVLNQIANIIDSDLYILPSSIHETILVSLKDNADPRDLQRIVQEVNREQVSEEEFLSDNIYYFSRASKQIKTVEI